jgi:flagellar basal body P-ring formation protein FlgA
MNTSVTDVYGRTILGIFAVAVLMVIARAAFAVPAIVTPAEAIEQAVARRIGGDVRVHAAAFETKVAPEAGLQALPEPGARSGQAVRFVLMAGKVRRGFAVTTVTISGTYARAARAIARGETVADEDVELVDAEWPPVAFTRMPAIREVAGLRARRNIARGEALTGVVLEVPPLVHAGDAVTVTAAVGSVKVTSQAIASSSGHRGDVIRVTSKPNGRPVRARITGQAQVEVLQ